MTRIRLCDDGSAARVCDETFDDRVIRECIGIVGYAGASRGLAPESDLIRITAKVSDVVLGPLDAA